MASIWGEVIGGLANLGGSAIAAGSAQSVNRRGIKLAREQMAFQERMSSTAYQRSAKDLEAAGLNRILAFGKPSSTPPGAQPPQLRVPGEHIAKGITNAATTAVQIATIKAIKATTKKTQAETVPLDIRNRILTGGEEIVDEGIQIVRDMNKPLNKSPKDFLKRLATGNLKQPTTAQEGLRESEKRIEAAASQTALQRTSDFIENYKRKTGRRPTRKIIDAFFKQQQKRYN